MAKADRTVGAARRICLLLNILRDEDQPVSLNYLSDALGDAMGKQANHSTLWRDMETLTQYGIVERKGREKLRGYLFKLSTNYRKAN